MADQCIRKLGDDWWSDDSDLSAACADLDVELSAADCIGFERSNLLFSTHGLCDGHGAGDTDGGSHSCGADDLQRGHTGTAYFSDRRHGIGYDQL